MGLGVAGCLGYCDSGRGCGLGGCRAVGAGAAANLVSSDGGRVCDTGVRYSIENLR